MRLPQYTWRKEDISTTLGKLYIRLYTSEKEIEIFRGSTDTLEILIDGKFHKPNPHNYKRTDISKEKIEVLDLTKYHINTGPRKILENILYVLSTEHPIRSKHFEFIEPSCMPQFESSSLEKPLNKNELNHLLFPISDYYKIKLHESLELVSGCLYPESKNQLNLKYLRSMISHQSNIRKIEENIIKNNLGLAYKTTYDYLRNNNLNQSFFAETFDCCIDTLIRCVKLFDIQGGIEFSSYSLSSMQSKLKGKRINGTVKSKRKYISIYSLREEDIPIMKPQKDKSNDADERYYLDLLNKVLKENLAGLAHKEIEVITRRYGLKGHKTETLEEIGCGNNPLNLTREYVRQIQIKALKKIRKVMQALEN